MADHCGRIAAHDRHTYRGFIGGEHNSEMLSCPGSPMADDPRFNILADYMPKHSRAGILTALAELDRADLLRVLLADEDRAVGLFAALVFADTGRWVTSVHAARAVLAALREVAGL